MRLYCVSDLHLQDGDEPFLFTAGKERVFAAVATEALQTEATLVLAGDVFDLTGITPTLNGVNDFFRTVAPDASPRRTHIGVAAQLRALHERFPGFFALLTKLAKDRRLCLIPGNHDCEIGMPAGREALGAALGVPAGELLIERSFRAGDFLFAVHGNEYDRSNQTDCNCRNRGAIITSALYHAVIPALVALGVPRHIADAVPAVRPEENIVDGLNLHLGESLTMNFLLAFVTLLRTNGYFTGLDLLKAWLATHWFRWAVTPSGIRKALADDTDLKFLTRRHAEAILKADEPTVAGDPPPAIVVMGHTHELDATHSYVNLGTWVDHVRGLKHEDLINVDRTLPVLVVDGQTGSLHDCLGIKGRVTDCRALWRRSPSAS